MTQATTWSVPLVGPATPTLMAQRTDDSLDALLTGHSGSSRPGYAVAGTVWQDTSVAGTVTVKFYDGSDDIVLWVVNTSTNVVTYSDVMPASNQTYGQCQLTLSGGNLLLSRKNGRLLTINGAHYAIPSSGPTLAATGLTPSTLYYIYAYMNSGTMTLEASTTVPATDATTGVQIKTGDATRSLVGMARPVTGPAWADSNTQRLVLSYYNRTTKLGQSNFTAIRTTTSATFVEINTEIRVEFLAWGDELLRFSTSGGFYNSTANASYSLIGLDGVSTWIAKAVEATAASYEVPLNMSGFVNPGIGYHYVTIGGRVGAGTGSWDGIGDGVCYLHAEIKG